MIEFRPITAEMAMRLSGLEAVHLGFEMTPDIAVELEAVGGEIAVVDGEPIAIAGILPRWEGVGMAWAWLSRDWRKYARAITDRIMAELDASPLRRIELAVKVGYDRGDAWAKRLGFVVETECAKKWGPDGSDYRLYVRLK